MTVRSAVLASHRSTDAEAITLATVPAGETWIVKEVRLHNGAAGTQSISLIAQHNETAATVLLASASPAGGQTSATALYCILDAGDTLTFACGDELASVWVSGSKLLGVAP